MARTLLTSGLLVLALSSGCTLIAGLGTDYSTGSGGDASMEDGGGGDSTTDVAADGPGEAASCDPTTCPTGCCAGSVCVTPAKQTNASCGGSAGGQCTACAAGQSCDLTKGKCVCDAASCPDGCCNGAGQCVPYPSQSVQSCGKGGAACGTCAPGESCASGACSCGGTTGCLGCCTGGTCEPLTGESSMSCGASGAACAACATGQTCDTTKGACVCNATSCPNGCCNGNTCVPYASQSSASCGTAGASCAMCASGSECSASGQCVCDATSCPMGCCSGNVCFPYASQKPNNCGTGGAACAACASGQDCTNGACTCGGTSGCTGCCAGNGTCEPLASESNASCGASGAACAACATGQACDTSTGACVCNASTCPSGCCNGNTCVPYASETAMECGVGGATCTACNSGQACSTSGATEGTCVCTPGACATGCCTGANACIPYASQSGQLCGTGGAACGACTGPENTCTTGVCTCPASAPNFCPAGGGASAFCTNFQTDKNNCGRCGHGCEGAACSGGMCQPIVLTPTAAVGGPVVDAGTVYFVDGNLYIDSIPIGGGTVASLVNTNVNSNGAGMQIAESSGEIYWTNYFAGTLMKATTGGSNVTTLVSGQFPVGVAVTSGEVYFGNAALPGEIMAIPVGGGTATTFASNQASNNSYFLAANPTYVAWAAKSVAFEPRAGGAGVGYAYTGNGVALDSTNLYWTAMGSGAFQAALAGGSVITLTKTQTWAVAVDASGVYLAAGGAAGSGGGVSILQVPIGGGTVTTLYSQGAQIVGIAVDPTSVYWTDAGRGLLKVAKP